MTAPPAGALEACLAMIEQYCQHSRAEHEHSPCSDHDDAPHGFDRNESHNENRYVCDCESWEPDPANNPNICRDAVRFLRTHGPALLAALRLREGVEQAWTELRLVACDLQLLRPNEPLSVAGRKHYAERINATADDLARVLEEGE